MGSKRSILTFKNKVRQTNNSPKQNKTFGQASLLFVDVPYYPAVIEGYVDDLITVVTVKDDWLDRAQNAIPLAIHAVCRPTNLNDLLPRAETIRERKLRGGGTPDEQKVILG